MWEKRKDLWCVPHTPLWLSLSCFSSHSFLQAYSDVIQRPRQEQLHSEPVSLPSLSLSLNLFLSFLYISKSMQSEARQGSEGRSNTIGVFSPKKKEDYHITSLSVASTVLCFRQCVGGGSGFNCQH